jgi:hypothetical protein
VQPTSPSSDDLQISVLVFLAMERISVARDRLAFALSRVLSAAEEKYARSDIEISGTLFSTARSRSISATARRCAPAIGNGDWSKTLDGAAQALMIDLLRRAEKNATKKGPTRKAART